MANGYLGKISAIVSANTADFDSKLSKSAAEVRKFAGSMQGSLTSAQSGSASALNGIYTSAQKLERALQAVASQKLSFKGFQGPDLQSAVTRMQGLYSAAEQVNKPLSNAVKTFGRLAISVQGEFNPALQSAQAAAEKLADTIDRTGTASVDQFSRVARQVEFTTAAMKRMEEAGAMVSGLATGQELRFQRPEMVSEMQRSASLQSQAAQMSPGAMASNGIAGLVSQQRAAAVETERLAAALENERLLVNGNVEAATAAYQSQLAVQRGLNDEIERRVGAEAAAAARTVAAAEGEIAVLQRRQQASKAAEVERQAQAQRVADSELANLQRVQQASKAAEVERQAQAQRVADSELANLQRVQQASKAAEVERQAQAKRRGEGEIATLIRREQAAKAEALGGDSGVNLGLDIESPRRQLSVLEGSITSLKSKIDTLPEPLRARFVPAIRDAEREFIRLSTAAVPMGSEIESARQRLVHLTQDANRAAAAMNFAGAFGGEGVSGINLGLDQRALQGYGAQLQILQGAIGRASAEARGPAVEAFNRLRNAVATAFDEGSIDSAAARANIVALRAEAIAAAAAVSRIRVSTLTREIGRAGDIGRQGFDRFSLAVNQGAYVVDDFLSSTGGLEQKLRAIGNNVTQLGFVIGGTTGLLVGLGAVLVGQAAVAIVRWINNGQTAEDKTKALNDALEKQKNVVKELAEAFKSLGDSMSANTFSDVGKAAQDFAKRRAEIEKKQREARNARVADLDPVVQRERALQNTLQGKIERETDIGRRIALTQELAASRRREKRRSDFLNDISDPTGDVAESTIRRAAARQRRAGSDDSVVEAVTRSADGIDSGSSADAIASQMRAVDRAIAALQRSSAETFLGFQTPAAIAANASIVELATLSARLANALNGIVDGIALAVLDSSRGAAETLRNAQEEVAEAIKAGLPGARLFGVALDKNAKALEEAYEKLEKAAEEEDATKKKTLVDEAKAKIEELKTQRDEIEKRAGDLRYERIVEPQRQMDARAERVGANLDVAQLPDGQLARRMREIEDKRETIRQQAAKQENQNPMAQRLFEESEAALSAEIAAIEAATLALKKFSEALVRASNEAAGNLSSAQQAADEARRADLRNSTPETRADRKRAEEDLDRQRQTERKAQQDIANQRAKDEEDVQQGEQLVKEQREIAPKAQSAMEARDAMIEAAREMRDAGIRQTGSFSGNAAAARAAGREDIALLQEKAEKAANDANAVLGGPWENLWDSIDAALAQAEFLAGLAENTFADEYARMREIDEQLKSGSLSANEQQQLRAERASLEDKVEPDVEMRRKRAEKAVEASTQEEEVRKSAERGRELRRTQEERFAEETMNGLQDIRHAYARDAENSNGIIDLVGLKAAEDRFMEERAKEERTATSTGRGREAFLNDRERFSRDIREGIVKDMTAGAIDQAGLMNIQGRRGLLEKGIQNQMEQVAPMLQGFEEERQTARIQGPSRAALQMTDVSTSQGAAELTRLLRGDDSAKDVNLAELRKQTAKFDDLIQAVKDANPGVLL